MQRAKGQGRADGDDLGSGSVPLTPPAGCAAHAPRERADGRRGGAERGRRVRDRPRTMDAREMGFGKEAFDICVDKVSTLAHPHSQAAGRVGDPSRSRPPTVRAD